MGKKNNNHVRGNADHTANPRNKRRMKITKDLNVVYDNEYDSIKLSIPADVMDIFKSFFLKFTIIPPHPNQNIQRVEIKSMNDHFNRLRNSKYSYESSFYNDVARVVGQRNFVVKGYLTWSLKHQFEDPATIQMFPPRCDISVPPLKICFLSVDQSNDYYLQVWKKITSSSKSLQNPELVRVPYKHMRIFPGTTIHGGGFKNLHSIGNFRIQLHIYNEYPYNSMVKNVYCNNYTFSHVTAKQLDLYRFEELQTYSSSPKGRFDNRKSYSTAIKNSSNTKTRVKDQDSKLSSLTNITDDGKNNLGAKAAFFKGVIPDKTLNPQFTFTRGDIKKV